ncbi:neurogenic locus notch homolog protein 1-like isoform X2 [Xenia sp. Carnegie-2017]|uniref:neurogenic locus notch homolog protein 1-like isoform X2 n=1 Tax=Xenia sp. Carnegie-2017 TaxID=2897299 RepID=UPI001F04FAA2|nr:neurogenic locus notch homolog protein 1-like isoform X2 [Xenia sp. Carnegie-2017]
MKSSLTVLSTLVLLMVIATKAKKGIVAKFCVNANWWKSFDKKGWSKCSTSKQFITGFYRSKLYTFLHDGIYKLEEAKCCLSSPGYRGQKSICVNANWWKTLDKKSTWSVCPQGYFLNGLYRTKGNHLHNIEEGNCCKPIRHPKRYGGCYNEYIRHAFDRKGWTTCKKAGYYVTGLYRDHKSDWLHNIDYFKCCKMAPVFNPCAKKPCKNGGLCLKKIKSYQCLCKPGYRGKNCGIYNACHTKPCINGGVCKRKGKLYSCKCKPGYFGKNCQSYNACHTKPCINGGVCQRKGKLYNCKCRPGYFGKNCQSYNACHTKPCINGGVCQRKGKLYNCKCRPGYFGKNCQFYNACHTKPCINGGVCQRKGKLYNCKCRPGYFGKNCQFYNACHTKPCINGGVCQRKGKLYNCKCKRGYFGKNCQSYNACHTKPCINGGVCQRKGKLYNCKCRPGYFGKNCQFYNACHTKPCINGGVCQRKGKLYNCKCRPGYFGKNCQFYNACHTKPCINGGVCQRKGKLYNCKCRPGYFGKNCQFYNACHTKPCINGGVCQRRGKSYNCKCKFGYFANKCQYTFIPRRCVNDNWWKSFDKKGWSRCDNAKQFITGFYRNKLKKFNNDGIYKLEEAKCCTSSSLYAGQRSTCINANWWKSLDRASTWSVCPQGYFLNGLYRSKGQRLHNIEMGKCCKPVNHPNKYAHCYNEHIRYAFDRKGWTTCKKVGYYVTGLYKNHNGDWLHNIDYFRCCKMWTGIGLAARGPLHDY